MNKNTAKKTAALDHVLPTGTPDQILKGALTLQKQRARVGAVQVAVTEAMANQGNAYDRQARSKALALLLGFSQGESAVAPMAAELAQALGIDVAALDNDLKRQQVAHDAFRESWAISSATRTGLLILDGTRRLARSTAAADLMAARDKLTGPAQKALDDDMADYNEAVAEDNAGKLATRQIGKRIKTATDQSLGAFQDRAHLIDTLSRLSDNESLSWDVLVKAGATLDQINAEGEGPASIDGAALPHLGKKAKGPASVDGATLPHLTPKQKGPSSGAGRKPNGAGNNRRNKRG